MTSLPEPVATARAYFRGEIDLDLDALVETATALMRIRYFQLSRRLLDEHGAIVESRDDLTNIEAVARFHAYVTYQDPDLASSERFDKARQILVERCGLERSDRPPSAEVIRVAGALYMARWASQGRHTDLLEALAVYQRGVEFYCQNPPHDLAPVFAEGVAYAIDILSSTRSSPAPIQKAHADEHRERALALAKPIVGAPPEQREDRVLTLLSIGQTHFALGHFDDADPTKTAWHWFARARDEAQDSKWILHAKLVDLLNIARMRGLQGCEARLGESLGVSLVAIEGTKLGRVGLALSGGGLRASLFHLGFLAKLAERDLLRHVSVMSCISGGAIVGTYYYLWLRKLLAAKPDADITQADYVELVKVVQERFFAAQTTNLRMKLLAQGGHNFALLVQAKFEVTKRFADLLDEELYRPIEQAWPQEAHRFGLSSPAGDSSEAPEHLTDLHVLPAGLATFHPNRDNLDRRAKVPLLVINATTMNTGHGWQFTSTYMGEPPRHVSLALDAGKRLRRFYYDDRSRSDSRKNRIRIVDAVAASACIPGLFPPVELGGHGDHYPDYAIALSDGGVHDNQGLGSLYENDCKTLLISDASGQTRTAPEGYAGVAIGALRAKSILMQRVRELQLEALEGRRQAGLIHSFLLVHLTMGLDRTPVDWTDCEDPYRRHDGPWFTLHGNPELTPARLRPQVLELLAQLRTDMDAHSEIEAFGLMAAAYHAAHSEFNEVERSCVELPADTRADGWMFSPMDQFVRGDLGDPGEAELDRVYRQLGKGRKRFGRLGSRPKRKSTRRSIDIGNRLWGLIAVAIGWVPAQINLRWITPRLLRDGRAPAAARTPATGELAEPKR